MSRREVRDDQHGTRTGYRYGCRCTQCCAAESAHSRRWREAHPDYARNYYEANRERLLEERRKYYEGNRERELEYNHAYYRGSRERLLAYARSYHLANRERRLEYARNYGEANRGYLTATQAERRRQLQADSPVVNGASGHPWEPHEDALLARIQSNIAAASALGRTYHSVVSRRKKLKAKARAAS